MNKDRKIGLDRLVASLTVRWILGFIFLMQGFGKVFNYGVEKIYSDFFAPKYQDLLPEFLTYATAYYTSYIELIAGALLVIGFKIRWALYALASVLVVVSFGHGLAEPIWDLSAVVFRAILLVTLLILPSEWDRFSLDYYLNRNGTD